MGLEEEAAMGKGVSIATIEQWADAIIALPASGALPSRTVLVPSEAHAHALRLELLDRGSSALAGTRFLTPVAAARAVLDAAGTAYEPGEELLRPLRVRAVLARRPALVNAHDPIAVHGGGWADAFAATIEQLEAGGLRSDDLDARVDPRLGDLQTVWRAIDADAGTSWSASRILAEATWLLSRQPTAWPFSGSVLARVTIGVDAVHARFLDAIPGVVLGVAPGRPLHDHACARVQALFGAGVVAPFAADGCAAEDGTELARLARGLFTPPSKEAAANPPDDTVSLELHAGVDEELDAVARWVLDEVATHATPLAELAVLVPAADPYVALVADRIGALVWPPAVEPTYVASGRAATHTAAGVRLLAVVAALSQALPADAIAALLPRLRLVEDVAHAAADGDERRRYIGPDKARRIVRELGSLGGSRLRPERALQWRERLARPGLDDLTRAVAPALGALVGIAEAVLEGVTLVGLWKQIARFAQDHLLAPSTMRALLDELSAVIARVVRDPAGAALRGREALELVEAQLRGLRLHEGRYGEPRIFVGTIAAAAGLRFTAVRVLGLAESRFPGTLRQDALLTPELRDALPRASVQTGEDYATGRSHALLQVIRGVRRRLVMSAPRADLDGGERDPAALFIEVAATLGRRDAHTGAPVRRVPSLADIDRDSFLPARHQRAARIAARPLSRACWLGHVARAPVAIPPAWTASTVTDPLVLQARRYGDGVLRTGDVLRGGVPTVTAELPLSASALRTLLACPQQFLLERILGFRPRRDERDGARIDPLAYGALVHHVVEAFARTHGAAFGARELDLVGWLAIADALVQRELEAFLERYPLLHTGSVEHEERRLRADVRRFLEADWTEGRPRTFIATELTFGDDAAPLALATAAGPLRITGRIDRLDVEDGLTLVRDVKTGRVRPRIDADSGPSLDIDLQLAIYMHVARALAPSLGIPVDVMASYAYVDPYAVATARQRTFRDDREALAAAGQRWLDVAAALLRERAFVRTSRPRVCARCAFEPVCGVELGDGAAPGATPEYAAAHGGESGAAIAAYRELES